MCLRLILSVLVSIAGLASAARVPGPEERIVGGSYIPIEYVPWQVSVLNVSLHHCGGVVYNDRAILTAVSNVSLADLSMLRIGAKVARC
ncbi:GM19447 [Drosophila sechellia]|uniref:GM19447 n=1 Tax=Drosophila sechellia TaxID=7238 RepID=B4I2I2_DROSE|nr:GM19447 [Drosophila sechellia]